MGWNALHLNAMDGNVDNIHEEIYKKGTVVQEHTELVSGNFSELVPTMCEIASSSSNSTLGFAFSYSTTRRHARKCPFH
jgi:hypothetical protein